MAFTMRQPIRLTTSFSAASKNLLRSAPTRAFHNGKAANSFFTSRSTVSSPAVRSAFKNSRSYQYQSAPAPPSANLVQKLLVGGAAVGGTLLATNLILNRETRESIPNYERSYLHSTFIHTGVGVGIIGLSAVQMIRSGFMFRMMATNPMIVMFGGLAASFATMIATRSISPDNTIAKYGAWTAFNATQGALLAPLMFMAPPALIARAGLYTAAMMGGLAFVGATAKENSYLYLGGPLVAGACVVAASGFAPLVLPATAVRTLAFTENLWLYGGLAVFGGFTLYDIQKILYHARLAHQGLMPRDPVNESISLELDFLNIFVRMVQILSMSGNRRK